jgi:hypothetical protein
MFLKYRPNTAYATPVITRNAMTPMDTPSPIDAATLRPGLGCGVVEGRSVDVGETRSDEEESRVGSKVDGIKEGEVLDITDEFSSSSVCVIVNKEVKVGNGASNDVRTALSVLVSTTSGGSVVTSDEVSASTVLVKTFTVVMKVVSGSIDMTIGVSPPVFVDSDMATKRARYGAIPCLCEGW